MEGSYSLTASTVVSCHVHLLLTDISFLRTSPSYGKVYEGSEGIQNLCRDRYIYIPIGKYLQSTLVISKSKGPSETLRDIRTSTYQMCRIDKNTNRTTKFHK